MSTAFVTSDLARALGQEGHSPVPVEDILATIYLENDRKEAA